MKKALLLIAFAGIVFSSNAQQGQIALSGNLGFNSGSSETKAGATTTEGPKTSSFNIGLSGGYFLTDNISAGLGIGYGSNSSTEKDSPSAGDETKNDTTAFSISPFARYTSSITDECSMFWQLNIPISSGGTKEEEKSGGTTTTTETTSSGFGVNIKPGISYFVSKAFAIEATYGELGYSSSTYKSKIGTTDVEKTKTDFGLNIDMGTLGFGLVYYIGR